MFLRRRVTQVTQQHTKARRLGGPSSTSRGRHHLRRPTDRAWTPLDLSAPAGQQDDPSPRNTMRSFGPSARASVAIGTTLGMLAFGLVAAFHPLFPVGPVGPGAIIAIVILALCAGIQIPQRVMLFICTRTWTRLRGKKGSADSMSLDLQGTAGDRQLYWIVLSVIALLAGLAAAASPLMVQTCRTLYAFLAGHFLWSKGTLGILQVIIVACCAIIPMTILGLALSCLHHLSCPYGRWDTRATAWLMMGVGMGTALAGGIIGRDGRVELVLIAASLPTFGAAIIAAVSRTSQTPTLQFGEVEGPLLPSWSDRWPVLLRASIIAVAGAGAGTAALASQVTVANGPPRFVRVAMMLFAMGIGVLTACYWRPKIARTIGGFGVACAAAGTSVALALLCGSALSGVGPVGQTLLECLSIGSIGLAMAYGRQALLDRVGSRSTVGATILTRSLVCAAVTVWVTAPLTQSLLSLSAAMVMLSLSLLALGGVLVIHEPGDSTSTRRMRLCIVFGPISAMITLALFFPNWWSIG